MAVAAGVIRVSIYGCYDREETGVVKFLTRRALGDADGQARIESAGLFHLDCRSGLTRPAAMAELTRAFGKAGRSDLVVLDRTPAFIGYDGPAARLAVVYDSFVI